MHEPRLLEPEQGVFIVTRPGPLLNGREEKSPVLAGQLSGNRVPQHGQPRHERNRRVLGEVEPMGGYDAPLDLADVGQVLAGTERRHRFGHAAHDEVLPQSRDQLGMDAGRQRLDRCEFLESQAIGLAAGGIEKLEEVERMERVQFDLADREGCGPRQFDSQQRSGRHDVGRRHLFCEVFQARECPRTGLNLVKKNECSAREGGRRIESAQQRQIAEHARRLQSALENGRQPRVSLEVKDVHPVVFGGAELREDVGFARLTSPLEHQGFSVRPLLPCPEVGGKVSPHGETSCHQSPSVSRF
jgi:hypothetical protein